MYHFSKATRPRRLRATASIRSLVRENHLHPGLLTYPMFVEPGLGTKTPISAMPGQYRYTVDLLGNEVQHLSSLGIRSVLLFGLPDSKDDRGSLSYSRSGIVQMALKAIKDAVPELLVITDVCLCSYTVHGHCGLTDRQGRILNDETLEILQLISLSHAEAGADVVAPSGMMDNMVQAIRVGLDSGSHEDVSILSYAVKYDSAFYGPFREAAKGAPQFGDRSTHQMDPANRREALREVQLDLAQGADMVMVKPALSYLDVTREIRERIPETPLFNYNVSGEYAMLKAAAAQGWLHEERAILEMLTSMRRAGADHIVTYHAKEIAERL